MNQPRDNEIERRAYEIWERNGRPEGREEEHWRQAEQELAGGAGRRGAAVAGALCAGRGPEPR